MKKILISVALLASIALAEISAPVVINYENNPYKKFYEDLVYKVDRTPTENYLVGIYLTSKDIAETLFKMKGISLLSKQQKDIQEIFTSEEYGKQVTEHFKNNYVDDITVKISAYHEAGHLLLLSYLNEPKYKEIIDSLNVYINLQRFQLHGNRASVNFNSLDFEDAKYLDSYMMSLLAGMVAEDIVFNQHHTGVSSDLDKWYLSAETIIKIYPDLVKEKKYVDLTKYSMIPKTTQQILQNNQEIDIFKQKQYSSVKIFLNRNRALLDEVAATLQEKHSLNNDEIKEIYKKIKY